MPRCFRCCEDFRTRQKFLDHLALHHPAGTSGATEVPTVYELEVIIGRPRQNLFCPHPYCLYLVKHVASTRTLARHFQRNHPEHDLVFKYKCDQCGVTVDAIDRSNHVCDHVDFVNCPNDSVSDGVNISLFAGDDLIDMSHSSPPASVGLQLAPNPRYCLPSFALGSASPSTIPATPTSQLPPAQSSEIPIDAGGSSSSSSVQFSPYALPPSSSIQLIPPTSSFNSSVEMPSDVRSDSFCLPVHERKLSPQLDDATPPSDFSAPYPSALSSPAPGLPIHQLAPDVADSAQRSPSSGIKVSVSPPGSLHLMDSQG